MPTIQSLPNKTHLFQCGHNNVSIEAFDPIFWQDKGSIGGSGQGRGEVWFIHHQDQSWVLRRYRRGGLISKFNQYAFLNQTPKKTRPFQELALLEHMRALDLPVPNPVGGMTKGVGLFYQAWLLTEKIEAAQDLFDYLKQHNLTPDLWYQLGQTIRRFHDNKVFHSDLNCHNIMIDLKQNFWLIDFDKCELRNSGTNWQQQNLDRLLRSLRKEANKNSMFQWQEQDWPHLVKGYQHG